MSDPAGILPSMVEINTCPLRDRRDLETVLSKGFDLIAPVAPGLRYRLVGTGAACLQGVDLPVGDVDLLGTGDLRRRGRTALVDLPCPASTQRYQVLAYFARYEIDGVGFSFSTLEQPCDDDGWECQGPGPWRHYVSVDCGGHRIDCVSLELRLTSEFLRNWPDRYRPLLAHLATRGADRELLDQSLAIRNVPDSLARLAQELPATGDR